MVKYRNVKVGEPSSAEQPKSRSSCFFGKGSEPIQELSGVAQPSSAAGGRGAPPRVAQPGLAARRAWNPQPRTAALQGPWPHAWPRLSVGGFLLTSAATGGMTKHPSRPYFCECGFG